MIRILVILSFTLFAGCASNVPVKQQITTFEPVPYVQLSHPEWAKNAAIYQMNVRQLTPEGTLRAAEEHLPRIRDLGADILWLMPIHPIGEKKRKGTMGSPYAVKDYRAVNPDFGTLDDFRHFVDRAHDLGLYVILDWVANHTAWDNAMIVDHPEWYTRDYTGQITHTTGTDWTDIADLDYDQPGLRRYMTEAMEYWVRDVGIDGYRCDVAGYVPLDFWNTVRRRLDAIKPVFMLAEWESRDLQANAFDVTYAWSWHSTLHNVAQGQANAGAVAGWYAGHQNIWPPDAWRMTFISNHDKNTWEGTQFDLFGDALEATIVLSVVGDGVPLIYSGQEAGNTKRLEFFEKNLIDWREHPIGELYGRLFALLETNTAIWHGRWGATMAPVVNDMPDQVYSFVRSNDRDSVFAVFNFSTERQNVRFTAPLPPGQYTDYFSGVTATLPAELELEPWGYRVFVR